MELKKEDIETFAKKFCETFYSKITGDIPYYTMGVLIQAFIDKLIDELVENFSEVFENNFRLSRDFEDRLIESYENILKEKLNLK